MNGWRICLSEGGIEMGGFLNVISTIAILIIAILILSIIIKFVYALFTLWKMDRARSDPFNYNWANPDWVVHLAQRIYLGKSDDQAWSAYRAVRKDLAAKEKDKQRLRKTQPEHDSKEQAKKELCEKMLNRVDIIKLVIYKVAKKDLSEKFADMDLCAKIAGAVANEIFCSHTAGSEIVMQANGEFVINEIRNLAVNHPDLKQPITDALRVHFFAKVELGELTGEGVLELFDKATERGIFIPGGTAPNPDEFLAMATRLYLKYEK
jgi:hypothetical protein